MKKEVDQDQREKFKDITGCKEFLNVETQAAEEIVENLTQTHMEKTMTIEDQANCEYESDPWWPASGNRKDNSSSGGIYESTLCKAD